MKYKLRELFLSREDKVRQILLRGGGTRGGSLYRQRGIYMRGGKGRKGAGRGRRFYIFRCA